MTQNLRRTTSRVSRITGTLSVLTIAAIMTACTSAAPTPTFGPIVESIEGTPPASNALTPHPAQPTATGTPPSGVPGQLATPTTAPLATAGPTANPIATTAPGTIAPIGTTQTLLPTPQPGAARTPLPTASLTLPPTIPPPVPTDTPTTNPPSPTPSPSATATLPPLAIQKDQGCVDTSTNELYIYGEIRNQSPQSYNIDDMIPAVFDASGQIAVTDYSLDMPGRYPYFVPPNSALPFELFVQLEQPSYTSYQLSLDAAPAVHSPRNNLTIQPIGSTPDDGDLWVDVRWTNPGPKLGYVTPIVTAYNSQGRVSNFGHEFPPDSYTITGTFNYTITLYSNPCWNAGDFIAPSIIGE